MIQPLITRVMLTLNGEPVLSDLIRENGVPIAVLTWGGPPDRQFPQEKVPLDEAHLEEVSIGGPVHWRYRLPVVAQREAPS